MAAILRKLFKPKATTNNVEKTINSLTQKDSSELIALFKSSTDFTLRKAIIDALADLDALAELKYAFQGKHSQDITDRMVNLVFGQMISLEERIEKVMLMDDQKQILQIATRFDETELRHAAISKLTNEEDLFDVASNNPVARLRHIAAERIKNYEKLQQLQTQFKGKDKTLVRIVKDKLAEAKQIAEEKQLKIDQLQLLTNQAETLANSEYQPGYSGKALHLKQQISDFESTDENLLSQFHSHLEVINKVLEHHAAEEAEAEKRAQEKVTNQSLANDVVNNMQAWLTNIEQIDFSQLTDKLESFTSEIKHFKAQFSPISLDANEETNFAFQTLLKSAINLENSLLACAENSLAIEQLLHQASEVKADQASKLFELQKQASQLIRLIRWPEALNKPKTIVKLETELHNIDANLLKLKSLQSENEKLLSEKLKKAERAIQDGQIKQAAQLAPAIQKLMDSLGHKSKKFSGKWNQIQTELRRFKDWQGYAETPKKEELIERMEALGESDLAPEALASAIKHLQDEWKSLGRGNRNVDQALWNKFKEAGDRAYEPCKEFYASESDYRQQNLISRETLCHELETFHQQQNWEQANWKFIKDLLQKSLDEWKKYSPVDRSKGKEVQVRFDSIRDQIFAHLKKEYDRNIEKKERIINKAEKLLEAEDLREAIDQVKALQQDWKTVGLTPMSVDRKLWKNFRSHCDGLFDKLNQQNQDRKAAINADVEKAESLIAEMKAITELSGDDLRSKQSDFDRLRSEFNNMSLPKSAYQRLGKQVSELEKTVQTEIKRAQETEINKKWLAARELSNLLDQNDHDGFDQQLATAAGNLTSSAKNALTARRNGNTPELDRLELCIRLEILLSKESPDADRARRMELQVAMLQQAMGQKSGSTVEQARSLECQWYQSLATDSALTDRFFALIDQL